MKTSTRIRKLAEQAEPLLPVQHAGPGRGHKGPRPKHQGGNSSAYLVARIARDRPDILARLQAGEFKTVRDAAREAGIIKPRRASDATE